MERIELKRLLEDVARGTVDIDDAVSRIGTSSFEDLGYAKPDFYRGMRTGVSEVVYGAGKSSGQIVGITEALLAAGQRHVLITRVSEEKAVDVERGLKVNSEGARIPIEFDETSGIMVVGERPKPTGNGTVVICCAGTSDLYCAEEAAITAEMMGSRVERVYDVGVAGIHRLLSYAPLFQRATAVVAIAGMEGALASVVGGLCPCPVIACPTSVGYGASLGGISALLAMLNSCSSGTSVVNIDNGFGAGYQAALIDHATVRNEGEE